MPTIGQHSGAVAMLYSLLMLGLLPAAFLLNGPPPAEDDPDDGPGGLARPPDADVGAVGDLLDEPEAAALPEAAHISPSADVLAEDDAADPADLSVPADTEEAEITGFRPGTDSLRLHITGDESAFFASTDEAGQATLHIERGAGETAITFVGLERVPVEDIYLTVEDADTGMVTSYALDQAGAAEQQDTAVDPADPTTPEPSAGGEAGPGLDPADPDLPAGPPAGDAGPGLDPADPALPEPPPTGAAEGLDPVDSEREEWAMTARGPVDSLIARDSDLLAPTGAANSESETGTDWDDQLSAAPGGDGTLAFTRGTPVPGGDTVLVDAGAGDDAVTVSGGTWAFGGNGDDVLADTAGASALFGGGGQDRLTAGPAGSVLDGGQGDDLLIGGAGDDRLDGGEHAGTGAGDDSIDGGPGDDVIRGGLGADTLSGGDGNDVIDSVGRAEERALVQERLFAWHDDGAADTLDGGAGDDMLILDGHDTATGGAGADVFRLYTAEEDAAVITDFVPGEDFLRITLDPSQHLEVPEVTVTASRDGTDGLVRVGGVAVAVLQGTPGATTADIHVEVLEDIRAA